MASIPDKIDKTNPLDSAIVSQFPANERLSRTATVDGFVSPIVAKSATYTVVADHALETHLATGTFTIPLTAAATLGAGFSLEILNVGTGVITIDPAGAETIDGAATRVLAADQRAIVKSDGTNWITFGANIFADDEISGDKVDGGTISNFASTGINDNATSTQLTVADTGISAAKFTGDVDVSADALTLAANQVLFTALEKFPTFSTTAKDRLQVNAGGTALEFVGGGMVDLGQFSPTVPAASIDTVWDAANNFEAIMIFIRQISPASGSQDLLIRVLEAGVPDAGNVYQDIGRGTNSNSPTTDTQWGSIARSSIRLTNTLNVHTADGSGISGVLKLTNVNGTQRTGVFWDLVHVDTVSAGRLQWSRGGSSVSSGAEIDGIRWFFSAGNVDVFDIQMFGIKP